MDEKKPRLEVNPDNDFLKSMMDRKIQGLPITGPDALALFLTGFPRTDAWKRPEVYRRGGYVNNYEAPSPNEIVAPMATTQQGGPYTLRPQDGSGLLLSILQALQKIGMFNNYQ